MPQDASSLLNLIYPVFSLNSNAWLTHSGLQHASKIVRQVCMLSLPHQCPCFGFSSTIGHVEGTWAGLAVGGDCHVGIR